MLNILSHFLFLFLIFNVNCISNSNEFSEKLRENNSIRLEKGLSQTILIEYKKDTNLFFDIRDDEIFQINILSINCNIKVEFKGEKIEQINFDTYSLKMDSVNNNITIKPIIDIINGEEKENYENKSCPLSINSINENKPQLNIDNKLDNIFYFQNSKFNLLNISYEIKEIVGDSFIALLFHFDKNSDFLINTIYKNDSCQTNLISKSIHNSSYLYINSEILLNASKDCSNGNIFINIKKVDNKNVVMHFKILEKDSISMIKKNSLNYGFITSKIIYQYYYMEVFKEEEGEIMLHNKRLYGELHGIIINKDKITMSDLNNPSKYPKKMQEDIDSRLLNYNPHSLRLKFDYNDTKKCYDGCYILITYEQKISEGDFPLIGYEFTLLSRSWNSSDYISNIVDIPFNEYLIGAFEKGSITHHYYSISIPDDAEKLIIQIEGNYIEGYYGEGRKRINTMKIMDNIKKLEIINNQHELILDTKQFNSNEKIISFAIRPKDYLGDIFSFYYFRIFTTKENEILFFPMDSQLGNLCVPEYDQKKSIYYCYSMFENNYNELATRFVVSSSNQNEYFKIYVTKIYKNGSMINEEKEFVFIYNETTNDIKSYLFKFEFTNSEIKNLISSLKDDIKYSFPQIYSSHMFYIYNFTKTCNFTTKNNYTLIYKYVFGTLSSTGYTVIPVLNFDQFYSNRNFKGKPFAIDIDSSIHNISFVMKNAEFIFYFQLEYNMRNKGITEVKSGETRSQIMTNGHFPLYYYIKIKDENYINMDVNLRLNSYDDSVLKNDFGIRGYLLDEDTMKRKINGESIQLGIPINGYYSNRFKIGLLQVNQNKTIDDNNYEYLLIEIINLDQTYIYSELLVEIVSREYSKDVYFMPINQYIIETFDDKNEKIRDKNQYYININQRGFSQVLIELSAECNDIELNFINKTNSSEFLYRITPITGFKKYRINKSDTDNVYFNVINPKQRNANYMIRYYYTNLGSEYTYIFDKEPKKEIIESNDENVTISLTFDAINIIYKGNPLNRSSLNIYFYIFGLLYNKNEKSDELLNTTSILQEQIPLYENKTINYYNLENPEKFVLVFKDIPRNNNFIYDLQLQINVVIEKNLFNEEFLIFNHKIDLSNIKLEEEKTYLWYILGPILGILFLCIIAFFIVKYIRLQKANTNLREEVKSLAFSSEIQKNVLVKEKISSQNETDYETKFI